MAARPRQPPSAANPLRLAVLSRHFKRTAGGAEAYAVDLTQTLAARGDYRITVFAQNFGAPLVGVHYQRVPFSLSRPRWLNQLWFATYTGWVTRRGFDAVLSNELVARASLQIWHVKPFRHHLLQRSRWRQVLAYLSVRQLVYLSLEFFRSQQPAVVPARLGQQQLQACYPDSIAARDCSLIPPGVTWPDSVVSRSDRLAAAAPIELLFIANDPVRKGLPVLLQALRQLPARFQLQVAGLTEPAMVQAVSDLGLSARVRFVGALHDLTAEYQRADLLVHPTQEDSFGMVVLEAMAHALPVIVTTAPYCGFAHVLAHQRDAWLLHSPHDVDALVSAITTLSTDRALYLTLAQQGRTLAYDYRWGQRAAQFHDLLCARSS